MNVIKRKSARAIIFQGNKIVSMKRIRDGRIFYTFPGGGMEEGESEEECVLREVFEEFGLVISPIKKVYIYESGSSIEHFYICRYISGEFGTGKGEEFHNVAKNGVYKPVYIEISDLPTLPLMPPEVASAFCEDYKNNGEALREDIKILNVCKIK